MTPRAVPRVSPDGTGDVPIAQEAHQTEGSRQAVVAAATDLFAERGYNQVTIRDIAARAGVSPAMVMKCGGSKRDLFLVAATLTPPPLPDVADGELGEALVQEVVDRFERAALEPLTRALVLRLSAPDPDAVRERFLTGYLDPLAARLGGGSDAAVRAELVVSALAGLSASLRIFDVPACRDVPDDVVRRYGAVVQRLIDS